MYDKLYTHATDKIRKLKEEQLITKELTVKRDKLELELNELIFTLKTYFQIQYTSLNRKNVYKRYTNIFTKDDIKQSGQEKLKLKIKEVQDKLSLIPQLPRTCVFENPDQIEFNPLSPHFIIDDTFKEELFERVNECFPYKELGKYIVKRYNSYMDGKSSLAKYEPKDSLESLFIRRVVNVTYLSDQRNYTVIFG